MKELNEEQNKKLEKLAMSYLKAVCNHRGYEKADIHQEITELFGKSFYPEDKLEYFAFIREFRENSRAVTDNLDKVYNLDFGYQAILPSKFREVGLDLCRLLKRYATRTQEELGVAN